MNFGDVLEYLKSGKSGEHKITIPSKFNMHEKTIVRLQKPDYQSKMTEQYLYLEKKRVSMTGEYNYRVPIQLSNEDILSEDWIIIL